MIALPAEIGIQTVPVVIKALLGLLMLGGCALLAFIAILAALKNRPGIAAFTSAVLAFGLLLPAGFVVTYLSRQSQPFAFDTTAMHIQTPALWIESHEPSPLSVRIPWLGILLIAGVAFAVVFSLFRRSAAGGTEKRRCGRGWWPVPFLLALPLLFLLSFHSLRSHRSESITFHAGHPRIEMNRFERRHEDLARRAAAIEAELHRRIAAMDIHELMDRFDAPRIVISAPRSVPFLAHFPHPLVSPVKSAAALLAAAEASAEAELPLEGDESAITTSHEPPADIELGADAEAALELIAAEAEPNDSHASADNATGQISAEAASTAMTAQPAGSATEKVESTNVEIEDELSTPIATASPKPKMNKPRPAWIDEKLTRIGEVRRDVLVTEEWSTAEECEQAQDIALMFRTYLHIQRLNGVPFNEELLRQKSKIGSFEAAWTDHHLHELQSAGITLDYVHREIAKEEYLETVDRSFGEMKKLYTLIEFTPATDRRLRQYWDAYQRQERFAVVGVGAAGVLGMLGLCYGLLKLDTWTKGYYTKRLFLGVPAAIIGLGTLLAMMVWG